MRMSRLQAHRGVSTEYPENTMSAFRGAILQGYQVIELDPGITADGQIVILHDETINRTARTASGAVLPVPIQISDLTYSEALAYDFGSWFSPKFRGERIPLLRDVLELAAQNGILIKIDNKFQRFDPQQRALLFETVRSSEAKVAFTCNDLFFAELVRGELPGAEVHYDGPVAEEILNRLSAVVPRELLTVWLPYPSEATAWVTVPKATPERCRMVKKYASLGIWILQDYEQWDDAVENLGADIVETPGSVKPFCRPGIRADIHMHTFYSHDGFCSEEELCREAREKGIDVIAFTDHCDIALCDGPDSWRHIDASVEAARKAERESAQKYGGKPEVLRGVELGEAPWKPEVSGKFLASGAYDVIIGSVHSVRSKKDSGSYSRIDFSAWTDKEIHTYLEQYFKDVQEMLEKVDCDIMAHLTCPLRYLNGKFGRQVDWHDYEEQIRQILQYIIAHGIALEINTSCLGSGYDALMPEEEIVALFVELGGYLVTFASDAHRAENLGYRMEDALAVMKKYGLRNLFYYKDRQPMACTLK